MLRTKRKWPRQQASHRVAQELCIHGHRSMKSITRHAITHGGSIEKLSGSQPFRHLSRSMDIQVPVSQQLLPMEANCRNLCPHGSRQLWVDVWGSPTVPRQVAMYAVSKLAMVLILWRSVAEQSNRIMPGLMPKDISSFWMVKISRKPVSEISIFELQRLENENCISKLCPNPLGTPPNSQIG